MTDIVTAIVWLAGSAFALAGSGRRSANARRVHANAGIDQSVDPRPGMPADWRGPSDGRFCVVHSRREHRSVCVADDARVAGHVIARACVLCRRSAVEGHCAR